MNINDFVEGTAYLILYRGQFKSDNEWEKICSFLDIPTTVNKINIDVERGSYHVV